MKTTTKCYATSAPGVEPSISEARVLTYGHKSGSLCVVGNLRCAKWYQLSDIDRIIVREEVERCE